MAFKEFEISGGILKFDRLKRSSMSAIDFSSDLMRYIVNCENLAKHPFGVLHKFLRDNRIDAIYAYAVMKCEDDYKKACNTDNDEPYFEKPKRKYNRKKKENE